MAIQSGGSGSASLSVYPLTPTVGQDATVTASFSGSVYNDGQPNEDGTTDQTITFTWSITGDVSGGNSETVTVRANENYSAGTKTADGSFQGPTTETASFDISWNGSSVVSGSGSLDVTTSPA